MRHGTSFTILALAMLGSGMFLPALGAQQSTNGDVVPRELLMAVLGLYGRFGTGAPEPSVQVGALPAAVRLRVPEAAGARVIGTVTMQYGTIVVLGASLSSDSLRRSLERSLQAKGFERSKRGISSGFVGTSPELPSMWCAAGTSMLLTAESRPNGTSVANIVFGEGPFDMGCERQLANASPLSDLPTLYDPEGAPAFTEKCFMAYPRSSGTGTRNAIALKWPPSALLDHYGKQLQDSGWSRADSAAAGVRVARTWTRRPSGGDVQYLTLSVMVPTEHPNCRIVDLRLEKLQAR